MKPSENETKVSPTGGIHAESGVSDVTERKRAEDALHESQALLTAIVDSASDLIWSVDPQDFGLLTFNRSLSDRFFRQRGVRLRTGMLPKDLTPTAEFIGTWEGFYRRVLADGSFTTEYVNHAGSSVLQLTFNLLKRDDKVFGISVFGKDITGQRQAEELLHKSDERFRLFMDNSPAVAWMKDDAGRYVYLNETYQKRLGVRLEDWQGKADSDLYPPAIAEQFRRNDKAAIAAGHSIEVSEESLGPDGKQSFWLVYKFPFHDASGQVLMAGIGLDITGRKRAQESLERSEAYLAEGQRLSHTGSWAWNFATGDLYWSQETYRIFGIDPAITTATLKEAFLQRIHPEDRPRIEQGLCQAASEKGYHETDYRIILPGGLIRYIHEAVYPVTSPAGAVIERYGLAMDVTERKRAEQQTRRFEALLSQSRDIILFIRHSDGRIVGANHAARRAYGYNREELLELSIDDLCVTDRGEMTRAQMDRAGADGVLFEAEHQRKDGSIFPVEVSSQGSSIDGTLTLLRVIRDITERKQAEELLRESEERFRATFENAGVGMALVDTEGHPIKSNPALRQMLGYSEEELCRMAFKEFTHPDDRELDLGLYRELMAGKRDKYEIEKRYLKKGGSVVWGLLTISLVKDRHCRPLYAIGMVQDITERKRTEEALRQSEAELREALLAAQMGVWKWTRATGSVTWDDNLYRIAGRDPKLPAPRYLEQEQSYSPESWQRLKVAVENTLVTGAPYELDLELVRPDGSKRWLIARGGPLLDQSGCITQIRGTVQDITDRKRAEEALGESEERFRLFMNNSPTVAWMKDVQGHYVYVSETYEKHLAVRLKDQMGKTDFELYPRVIAEQFRLNDQAALEAGHPIEVIEESLSPHGQACYWLAYKFPFQNAAGQVFVGGIGMEITERMRMERDLHSSLEQMRALTGRLQSVREEERTRVAREIHDQLGQALTAIKIDLSLLIQDLPGDTKQQYQPILKEVDETIELVRKISTELRPGILDALGLVAAIEWAADEFESRNGIKCRWDLPPDDIVIDQERATALFRILQEALTNVARHAGATEVNVRLAFEGGSLMLEIRDDGNGITDEQISAGTALGILGIRERALLLEGELFIRGIPGKGTSVKVRLPPTHPNRAGEGT